MTEQKITQCPICKAFIKYNGIQEHVNVKHPEYAERLRIGTRKLLKRIVVSKEREDGRI